MPLGGEEPGEDGVKGMKVPPGEGGAKSCTPRTMIAGEGAPRAGEGGREGEPAGEAAGVVGP